MDVRYLHRVCLILCYLIVQLSSVIAECPVDSIWSNHARKCVSCVDVCALARGSDCFSRCLGTSSASDTSGLTRVRLDVFGQKCINVVCLDFSYCDPGVGECTPCDQLCDHHRIQGTTEQCRHKCPKYFNRMERVTTEAPRTDVLRRSTSVEPRDTSTLPDARQQDHSVASSDEFKFSVVTIVIVIILAGIAVLLWKTKYLAKMCRPTPQPEEQKSSLPCSQEGEGDLINSRTPLTAPRGPIAQEKNFPSAESGHQSDHTVDLGVEMGHPEICIPYTEVDGPGTQSTAPKRCVDDRLVF
ncbi:uncharacterized protein [Haliotis cracherodii]|uniref:uncharacterized protein n=1 Tax=Haliotis cracherodii TaxID=6455 RepID=UPI0039ECB02D